MRLSVFYLTLVYLIISSCSIAQDIHFSPVKPPDEAGNSLILGITQDQQGFLWLATQNGLYKYDGYQYTAYLNEQKNPNSLGSNYIECVTAVKDGSIWVGHYGRGNGAERLDPATGIFTHYRHNKNDTTTIASDSVAAIFQDHEGTIWIGTNHGLDKFDSKTNKFIHYKHNPKDPSSLSYDGVRVLYEDRKGALWVGTGNAFYDETPGNEGGLNKLNRQTAKFTRYLHKENDPQSLMDNRVRALFEDSRGNFWVGTGGDGLHIMNRKNGTFERYLFDPAHPDKLSRPPVQSTFNYAIDHITFITEDNKGRIWIGTFQGGINVWDPATQKITYYGNDKKSKELLQDENFWTGYKTKDGVIWISTWFGVNRLYKANPYETRVPHTYISDTIYAFTEDNANLLWMASRGLVNKDNTGKKQRILLDKNLFSYKNSIYYIAKDNAGQLWLATNGGLYSFDPVTHNLKAYRHENNNANSLPSDTVYMARSAGIGLWVSTFNGLGLMDTKTGMFKNYLHDQEDSNSISDNHIRDIATESNGDLWIGTDNGLNRFDKQRGYFKKYLDGLNIFFVMKDSEGNVWTATNEGTAYRYNEQKDIFLEYTDETGLLKHGTYVWDIVEDNHKNLWFSTSKGIIELDAKTNETTLYGKNRGVDVRNILGWGYAHKNGEVLFGDTAGYFSFNDQLLKENIPPPVVNITNFSLANTMSGSAEGNFSNLITQQKDIRLRHDQNVFSFQFSSVDFISAHEDTRLLYMLENYDKNWRPGNNEQPAYYFNVPPGQYVFKVKASNGYGIWAQKEITIIINPPFWETWWFRVLSVIALIVVIYAIIIDRSRKLKAENIRLEEKVNERTQQLQQSIHELKSTQAQLIHSEKMASLGELTAGIAHEIQNPLNFVNNFSDVNKELLVEMKDEMNKGNIDDANTIANDIIDNEEKINHHGKRADAIVKGMLQHSRTNTGIKEPTDINKLADEYLRLSYHGLRAKDKSFNADFKTDFDESLSADEAGIGKINIVPQDIGRVLLNLFNNAFYAVKSPQPLKGSNAYEPTVSVSTKKLDDKILISVKDNGNGVPQNIVDKIFQPFFTTKPTGQGTGLGLSLAYDIIKAHGGEIKVESKEGEGTEFIIQLSI